MRRPTPLPAAPEPDRERGASVPVPDRAHPADRAAPVVPLTPAAAEAPSTSEPATIDGVGSGARPVWRAARARRRVLRAEVRRFTAVRRRRRWLLMGSAAAVLLVVLGSVGAAYSPLFAVEKVVVVGTGALDASAVERALDSQLGTPLARVDESAVKAALVAFPLVESYRLEARPPHDLVVRIVERTPVGAMQGPAGFTVVDAAGVALSTSPARPAGTPVLTVAGGLEGPAFDAVGHVMRALPASIRARVGAVAATSPNDVILTLTGPDARVVWGSAEESAKKALVLDRLMASRPGEAEYDVSSSAAVVVR